MAVAGRFFFPPTVVSTARRELGSYLAGIDRGPGALDDAAWLRWLCEASEHSTRRPQSEAMRDDGREVWRCGRAYGAIRFVVEPASSAGDLPVCVAVRR